MFKRRNSIPKWEQKKGSEPSARPYILGGEPFGWAYCLGLIHVSDYENGDGITNCYI